MKDDLIWTDLLDAAERASLNPAVFNETHREIVAQIVAFLDAPLQTERPRKRWFRQERPTIQPTPPIIICGVPGTGKTTFLYVLDTVLRAHFGLPDAVTAVMQKADGRTHTVHKRLFDGRAISLLSVSKWAELLHFYAWDTHQHRFDDAALHTFIRITLVPMRVLFADEVEMIGYAPTLPDLAKNGILVVGTSNQTAFRQLEQHDMPAQIYQFGGDDMRAGDPADAVVTADDPLWQLFVQAGQQPTARHEQLAFQVWENGGDPAVLLDFRPMIEAPMLDNQWLAFLQQVKGSAATLTLLLDNFSLETLRTNYNGIIRFVALFDAIEQLGVGVLVRNVTARPQLSREAINHMQVTIETARGLPEPIKRRVVVGIGRCTSRLGQAGYRARQ